MSSDYNILIDGVAIWHGSGVPSSLFWGEATWGDYIANEWGGLMESFIWDSGESESFTL